MESDVPPVGNDARGLLCPSPAAIAREIVPVQRLVGLHPDSPPLRKVATDKWEFTRKGKARRFSYLECAALQGFPHPEDFDVCSVPLRFRAIGNAVPPPMFAAVAKALVTQLESP